MCERRNIERCISDIKFDIVGSDLHLVSTTGHASQSSPPFSIFFNSGATVRAATKAGLRFRLDSEGLGTKYCRRTRKGIAEDEYCIPAVHIQISFTYSS